MLLRALGYGSGTQRRFGHVASASGRVRGREGGRRVGGVGGSSSRIWSGACMSRSDTAGAGESSVEVSAPQPQDGP